MIDEKVLNDTAASNDVSLAGIVSSLFFCLAKNVTSIMRAVNNKSKGGLL